MPPLFCLNKTGGNMTTLTRNPETYDLLQSTKFRLTFERLPNLTFFCQLANLPGVSLTEIPHNTPFIDLYVPGEKLVYDLFNVSFLVDEKLNGWTDIHDWVRGLTFPVEYQEYVSMLKKNQQGNLRQSLVKSMPQYSDAILTVYTNKNNPNFRIKLYDCFPTSLSSIQFSTSDSVENIITADATFRFSYYDYERL
jgi:hypothetical protein